MTGTGERLWESQAVLPISYSSWETGRRSGASLRGEEQEDCGQEAFAVGVGSTGAVQP